ncbi:hypothetical protein [Methylobacterium indicum]|uniref:hypothetical protein n=1 Tax=Methylobacterium indicum TaxID=1775910 RepID=UPI0024355847|nr:hypothetical protein [Methylobacterium indicum]
MGRRAANVIRHDEIGVVQGVVGAFDEERPVAPVEVAFRRQTFGEQDVVAV